MQLKTITHVAIIMSMMATFQSFADNKQCELDACKGIEVTQMNEYFKSFSIQKHDKELLGHTLEKHVGKSKDWLEGSLSSDRHKKFASTYIDAETANKAIQEIIADNQEKINKWLDGDDDKKRLSLNKIFDHKIGTIIGKESTELKDCNIGIIVLKRTERNKKAFFILTSYPVSNQKEIDEYKKALNWKNDSKYKY